MSLNPDDCEFKQEGLCCHIEHPCQFRGPGWECNATEADVITEEEWEATQTSTTTTTKKESNYIILYNSIFGKKNQRGFSFG